MLYLLDTANIEAIRRSWDVYPLAGVTTNPTLIAKEGGDFLGRLRTIRAVTGEEAMLHVQAVSREAAGIVGEAEYLAEALGAGLYVKIPVTAEGLKAIKILRGRGIETTATAVFTPQQALLAAVAGAAFVAPYVNRLDNICGDGPRVVSEIVRLLAVHGLTTKVLAASFKNAEQVQAVSMAGSQAVTVGPDILELLLAHPLTDAAVDRFGGDWEAAYGPGKTTRDV